MQAVTAHASKKNNKNKRTAAGLNRRWCGTKSLNLQLTTYLHYLSAFHYLLCCFWPQQTLLFNEKALKKYPLYTTCKQQTHTYWDYLMNTVENLEARESLIFHSGVSRGQKYILKSQYWIYMSGQKHDYKWMLMFLSEIIVNVFTIIFVIITCFHCLHSGKENLQLQI